jgi:FK506-binding protein 1
MSQPDSCSAPDASARVLRSGVQLRTLRSGNGTDFPQKGQLCRLHFSVRLATGGAPFGSSRMTGPLILRQGVGQVVAGLDDALLYISKGELVEVTVPPGRAFGARGYPPTVPPDTALIYELELLAIEGH